MNSHTLLNTEEYGISSTEELEELIDEVVDEKVDSYIEFKGLDTRILNHSTSNPLDSLLRVVCDSNSTLDERKQSFMYMYKSSYLSKNEYCIKGLLTLLSDDNIPVETRFLWLNSIRFLSDSLEVGLHGYVYWFYRHSEPILYQLLSAQFILSNQLQNHPYIKTHVKHAHQLLYQTAKSENHTVEVRSDAADMLIRLGTPNFREASKQIIEKLGNQFIEKRKQTVYTNAQNIHEITKVSQAIQALAKKTDKEEVAKLNIDTIYIWLQSEPIALESYQRIILDTATYDGYTMVDIMKYIWLTIQYSDHRLELENRWVEELIEMNGWCSTGHLVRLLNVLQGFDEDVVVKMDEKTELRSAVYARLQFSMKKLSKELQEELSMAFCGEDKELLKEFVEEYSPYDELRSEYREVEQSVFDDWYREIIRSYLGETR